MTTSHILTISSVCLCAMATPAMAQETYLFCDFEKGIPSNFVTYDVDENEPSVDVKTYGFTKGTAWISYTIKAENNTVACSTSWYTPSGTSDDWLVSAPFTVKSSKAVLRWSACASDKKYRDGYSVYVSTKGNRPEDFTAEPVLSVTAEEATWTKHEVSLAEYEGQQVWVAFVNNSKNKSRLYVDDIYAGEPSDIYVLVNLDYNISYEGDAYITGYACSESAEPVKGYTVGYTCNGEDYSQSYPDSVLTAGKKIPFSLKKPISVTDGVTQPYTVWIKTATSSYSLERDVTPFAQRAVAEECTGQWCAWCVRGIVYLDMMKKKYPDTFIGIAVHNADQMSNSYYDSEINSLGTSGFPYVFLNRTQKGDPLDIETMYNTVMKTPSMSRVSVSATLNADRQLDITSSVAFAENHEEELKLAFAVIENNIHQPDNKKFGQNNAYAGGDQGAMGGYENYDSYIPATEMYFQDVARCLIDDKFYGIEGSLPSSFTAGEAVTYTHSSDLSAITIFQDTEVEIVALLINADGKIVNAAKAPVKSLVDGISKIENSKLKSQDSACYNLIGQRVILRQGSATGTKGIVIYNGKKYVK